MADFYLLLNNWNATNRKKWLWNVLLGFSTIKWTWRFMDVLTLSISWFFIGFYWTENFSLIHESLDQIRTSSKPKLSSMAEIEFLYLAHRVKLQLSSKLNYYLFSKLLRKKSIFGRYISLYVKVNSKIVSRNDESFLVNGWVIISSSSERLRSLLNLDDRRE